MEKISKKRKEVLNKTNVDKIYALDEAIDIVKENAKSKFFLDLRNANWSLNTKKAINFFLTVFPSLQKICFSIGIVCIST